MMVKIEKLIVKVADDYKHNKNIFSFKIAGIVILSSLLLYVITFTVAYFNAKELIAEQHAKNVILGVMVDDIETEEEKDSKKNEKSNVDTPEDGKSIDESLTNGKVSNQIDLNAFKSQAEINELEKELKETQNKIESNIRLINDLTLNEADFITYDNLFSDISNYLDFKKFNDIEQQKNKYKIIVNNKAYQKIINEAGIKNLKLESQIPKNETEISESFEKLKNIINRKINANDEALRLTAKNDTLNFIHKELRDAIELKKTNKVPIQEYRLQKKLLIKNLYKINKLNINSSIERAVYYIALHKALMMVIIIFSTLMSLCVFAISSKGWNGSDFALKSVALCVFVVMGLSNLINTVQSPKHNIKLYLEKADNNFKAQVAIVKLYVSFDEKNEKEIDELVNKNFDLISKISDILPQTNEGGIQENALDAQKLMGAM